MLSSTTCPETIGKSRLSADKAGYAEKKSLQFLVILLFVLQTNLFPQSPIVQQIIDSVNIDSLIYFVKELSGDVPTIINGTSQTILSRHRDQPGNALAETYLKQKLESYGLPVTIQNYSSTGNNVLATQVGTVFPNKKFIICAHYDAMPAGPIAPGADDNGNAVTAVLEAARIFTQYSFPFTIVYALWDEEEVSPWLIGSTYYSSQAAAAGDSILGVINLEMLGWDGDNDGLCAVQEPDIVHAVQIRNNMLEINNQYGINLNIFPDSPIADSDQAPFWYNGFDVILFDQYTWEGERNPYYHTINDRVQYINKPYYLKMAKLALGTLAFLALNLNFDIIHRPIATVVPVQSTNTNLFIYTGKQIGAGSLAPRMYYRTKEFGSSYGGFNEVVGTSTGGGNYAFNIPVLPNGTFVQYYLAVQDENSTIVRTSPLGGSGYNPPGNIPPATFYEFLIADLTAIVSDEADSITNWTASGGWNTTTEKFVSPPTSFTDSPGGNYPINSNAVLTYNNQVQVLNAYKTFLEFDTQYFLELGYEYAQVQISTNNGSTWTPLKGQYTILGRNLTNGTTFEHYYGGVQSTWVHEIMDISNYANHPFKFRYLFKTDDMYYPMDGWYVDNVKVSVFASILGQQPSIDKFYARKDLDYVLFRIKLLDLYNHQFTSQVICANLNSHTIRLANSFG